MKIHGFLLSFAIILSVFLSGCSEENNPPIIHCAGADIVSGFTPLNVSFFVNASDPDGDISSYKWIFGDSGVSNESNPSHTYLFPGVFNVTLIIIDNDEGYAVIDNITVTVLSKDIDTDGDGIADYIDSDDDNDGIDDIDDYAPYFDAALNISLESIRILGAVDTPSSDDASAEVFFTVSLCEKTSGLNDKICAIFFYNPSYVICQEAKEKIDALNLNYPLDVKIYDIPKNYALLLQYYNAFNVSQEDYDTFAIFMGDSYYHKINHFVLLESKIKNLIERGLPCPEIHFGENNEIMDYEEIIIASPPGFSYWDGVPIDSPFHVDWFFLYDISDDRRFFDVRIEMYEWDNDSVEQLDIDGTIDGDFSLDIQYDMATGEWTGDDTDGITTGTDDEGTVFEKDARIDYDITTVEYLLTPGNTDTDGDGVDDDDDPDDDNDEILDAFDFVPKADVGIVVSIDRIRIYDFVKKKPNYTYVDAIAYIYGKGISIQDAGKKIFIDRDTIVNWSSNPCNVPDDALHHTIKIKLTDGLHTRFDINGDNPSVDENGQTLTIDYSLGNYVGNQITGVADGSMDDNDSTFFGEYDAKIWYTVSTVDMGG